MKRVKTAELVPGMVTGEDVFNFNGQMIFPKGFILTDRAISRLSFYAIDSLRVEDEIIEAPAPKPVEQITVPSHKQRIINSPEFKEFKSSNKKKVMKGVNELTSLDLFIASFNFSILFRSRSLMSR